MEFASDQPSASHDAIRPGRATRQAPSHNHLAQPASSSQAMISWTGRGWRGLAWNRQ